MGLRDRKTSRIREQGYNGYSSDGSRALYRKVGAFFVRIAKSIAQLFKKILAFEYSQVVIRENRDDRKSHFAETTFGGIAIAIGSILGLLIILWIGSFL